MSSKTLGGLLRSDVLEIDWIDLLVTPIVAAAVGFAVWYFQSRLDALRRAQDRLHDERRKVYSDVLTPMIRAFAGIRDRRETERAMKEIQSFDWRRTSFEFNLIGSDKVVQSFNTLMQYLYRMEDAGPKQASAAELLRLWGAFLLEIRRDVGDPKTMLAPGDMLRSQIKDIDDLLSESRS